MELLITEWDPGGETSVCREVLPQVIRSSVRKHCQTDEPYLRNQVPVLTSCKYVSPDLPQGNPRGGWEQVQAQSDLKKKKKCVMALSPIHFPNLVISFLILSCSGLKLVLLSPQTLPAVQTDFRVIWQRWRCSALQGVARVVLYTQALT